ncbi:PREDICTED: pregnancy zone protein-like, partial [Galeopterus variegatus]|uniref:Pregnancy zone protein-like n=1 Tax=Galeopterus variegatus TaxID=482537 RepID=A0ABM0SJX7_GALVR
MGKDRLPHLWFMLLVVLFPASDSDSTEPQYMMLVPFLLHTVTPEKGCLLLSHLNETVTVSASLESVRGNRSLFTELVVEQDLFRCVSFTLPRISSPSEVAFLTVQIKRPTRDFRKRNTVLVKNAHSQIFVQTDEPIYEPGQTGTFHVVSMDENFHPQNELVKVHVPKIISILDEKVHMLVCGIYTYRKTVPVLAMVSMCRKVLHVPTCHKQEFCEKFSQQLNGNGCITQQVKTNLLQTKNMGYEMKLRVEAKIREERTGLNLTFTGNGTSEVTNIVTKLIFVKADSHFRRGIPFLD